MNNKLKTPLIAGAAGIAVYYFFPQVKELVVGGEFSSGGGGAAQQNDATFKEGNTATTTTGQIVEGVLTKKQLSFITSNLDTSLGESSLNTFNFDGGQTASILTTPVGNERALTSDIGLFANTNTLFSYTNEKGEIVGGSDFKNLQSVTADRARSSSGSKKNVANFVSGSTAKRSSSSKKSNSISNAKSKVVRDYENKNLVSTRKTEKQIKTENDFNKLIGRSKKETKKLYTPAPKKTTKKKSFFSRWF